MLVIICTKYGKNPSRTVDATERTRFSRPRPNDFEDIGQGQRPGEGTLTMKVTTYAPPFRPPFLGLWKICIVSVPIFEQKWGKCRISTPIFGQHLTKCIVSPPFLALCSISSQRAVLSIPIQNPTENPPPPGVRGHWQYVYYHIFTYIQDTGCKISIHWK